MLQIPSALKRFLPKKNWVKTPFPLKWIYPDRVWKIPSRKGKTIYLTFDDGPTPETTPWVLEQLKEFDAKATFFCVGKKIKNQPDIFDALKREGHKFGNHTFSHLDGKTNFEEAYIEDVEKADSVINSNLFRPPFGRLGKVQEKILLEQGYKIIMWDVQSKDYDSQTSPEQCLRNVLKYASEGSIILFHDTREIEGKLRYVLPKVLKHFSEKGFRFEGVE